MLIFVPKENPSVETRTAIVPDTVNRLVRLGATVAVEAGVGETIGYADAQYERVGASVYQDRKQGLSWADVVFRVRKPSPEDVHAMKQGSLYVGYLDPFQDFALLDAFVSAGVNAVAMELIPRTTLAQKMDALSSQANLAGYVAVIVAAERINMVFPMMMTPAGTIKPARVFVIGCGVAGLQAIATARRLGARVEAFDTRPVVEEQVKSLGAQFVKVDLGETGQTKDGYARELTPEQLAKQKEAMAAVIAQSDVVITTAQVFGKRAPLIVTREMVQRMRPGSVIIDLAVETGGNVEGSKPNEEVVDNGVRIIGLAGAPARVSFHASQMYAANLCNFVEHFWDKETKSVRINLDDEIMNGCLVVYQGSIRHPMVLERRGK